MVVVAEPGLTPTVSDLQGMALVPSLRHISVLGQLLLEGTGMCELGLARLGLAHPLSQLPCGGGGASL